MAVNNSLNAQATLSLAGNLTTSGANALTLTTTGSTNVTLPTSGTLATTTQVLAWSAVSSSGSLTVNTGTITTSGSLVTLTLPSTAAVGSVFYITGSPAGTGGWKIAQNAGQIINFGSVVTTTGTGGSLASSNQYDSVALVCTTANTNFSVLFAQGNLTYV